LNSDRDLQTAALEELALAPNYQRWLAGMAEPYLGDRALELGSGLGDYAHAWLQGGASELWLTEADDERLGTLAARFAEDSRVHVGTLESALESGKRFTSFVSFNVLEHVEDPVGLLRDVQPALEVGAPVVSFVPAFPFAMSDFDRRIGHFRRYTKETMAAQLSAAGLTIETLRYVNMPGLLAWTAGMRFLKLSPNDGPFARWWDHFVVPVTRRVEGGRSVPFGQSLWAVARVRERE
jgi:hypothetical protein